MTTLKDWLGRAEEEKMKRRKVKKNNKKYRRIRISKEEVKKNK